MGKFITLREEFESETGAHPFADQQYIEWLEKLVERQRQVKNCSIPDVSGSLLIAKELLKSIESADPNVVDRYEDSDHIVRDLHSKCSKLIDELSCNDR